MNHQIFRAALKAIKVPHRTVSSSSSCYRAAVALDVKLKEEIHPKIGNREVVGYGVNGSASYVDRSEFPCPAIRFREPTAEVIKLQEKEKGDWKKLTKDEKKTLYRYSFCQTYSEMNAPTGEWKFILAAIILVIAGTGWLALFVRKFVYPPPQRTLTREWQEASMQRMLDQQQGAIFGVSSKWDHEKQEWKQ